MDPRDYADARRHALARAAVELGVPEEEAPPLVEQVLESHARRIRRAADPDPLVREALEHAVRRRAGPASPSAHHPLTGAAGRGGSGREGRRSRWPAVAALTIALVAIAVAWTALRREVPPVDHLRADQVPSVFGYDVGAARRLLSDRGLEVTVTPFRSCEVLGRAVGAIPPTGSTYRRGQRITVLASIPEDVACLPDYQDRSSAWRFLDFATGHAAAPLFARRVRVFIDDGEPTVLTRRQANDPSAWEPTGVLDALRDAVGRVRLTDDQPVTYAVPSLQVVPLRDRRGACARPLPSAVARLPGLSFVIEAPDSAACVDHVDLLRTADDPAAPLAAVVLGVAG